MRHEPILLLLTAVVSIAWTGVAAADPPSTSQQAAACWQRLGRTFGFGWSDGYHACASRGHRWGDNLPPASYAPPGGGWQCAGGCPPSGLPAAGPAVGVPQHAPPDALLPLPSVLEQESEPTALQQWGERPQRLSRAPAPAAWKWIREPVDR